MAFSAFWSLMKFIQAFSLFSAAALHSDSSSRSPDPCAAIAGLKWVDTADVRACFSFFPVNFTEKTNIIDVITKTLAFHTSVNYEIKAPAPFSQDVHEDIMSDLATINYTHYESDFDLHIAFSRALKRLDDGHCVYINSCYDGLYISYVPIPLTHLTDSSGIQHVYISPEAFSVAQAEFSDELDYWQKALPGQLKDNLASLSGAEVLQINGAPPYDAVDANALITGTFQALGTRQNSFFASYNLASGGWTYIMGNFAQQSLPIIDEVSLTVLRANSSDPEYFTMPYRSRISPTAVNWTDSASFRANNCVAIPGTNGLDIYATSQQLQSSSSSDPDKPVSKFQQQPTLSKTDSSNHVVSVYLDSQPLSNVVLPPELQPPATPVNGTSGVAAFYMLPDNITGVLALGSFASSSFAGLQNSLLTGLTNLKQMGATQLVVDVTNNGGGFICIAHWLHRIISGPRNSTVPQAGLYTETRDGPLAQLILKQILAGKDPSALLLYNPLQWRFANNTNFSADYDWLQPPVQMVINGHPDAYSQRLGQECQPFNVRPPMTALFDPKKVAIVSNGRCASSCSIFSITMAKEDGAKTVVFGGRNDVQQEYCGTVGGQSTDFSTIDTEVKTTQLKQNPLAPPDFLTNSIQGLTWRLAFGVWNTTAPEEWQDHPADFSLPLTMKNVNNPFAIWKDVVAKVFG